VLATCLSVIAVPAVAQEAPASVDQGAMQMPMPKPGQSHQAMMTANPLGIESDRDGSGTSWLPDSSPAHGAMHHSGAWMLMLHGNAFLEYIKTGTDRGDDQFGSINWIMGTAQRSAGGGQLQFRLMLSAEPATVGHCGYPSLLQSGEFCDGAPLHDRQHPHDLFMEAVADYRRAINDRVAFELYGGPVGEPALGPTAFPHRLSALPNPIAPISHHWLDSTHISFGVITGAVYGRRWKAEVSAFNGREPDDQRWDFDLAPLDSYSGRFWLLPTPQWALQVSAGHLTEAEFRLSGSRADVTRTTASATYHRLVSSRLWATTIAWGQNRENEPPVSHGFGASHTTSAFTAETAADVTAKDYVFGRAELAGKTPGELGVPETIQAVFTVGKLQAGYTRWLNESHGVRVGAGGSVGVSIVPETLATFYGGRVGAEFALFLTVRPH
jgi:hypothetical protein